MLEAEWLSLDWTVYEDKSEVSCCVDEGEQAN